MLLDANPGDPTQPSSPSFPVTDKAINKQIADPHHSISATTSQVYGYGPVDVSKPAPMSGFVRDYEPHNQTIMDCFSPDHVPSLSALASQFAVFNGNFCTFVEPFDLALCVNLLFGC